MVTTYMYRYTCSFNTGVNKRPDSLYHIIKNELKLNRTALRHGVHITTAYFGLKKCSWAIEHKEKKILKMYHI